MGEPERLRVFVNGTAGDVPRGATLLDAVRAVDPALAEAVAAGQRAIADSRGLVIAASVAATGGAVLRIVSARPPKGGTTAA